MEGDDRKIAVLFGSQTGTTEDVAKRIFRDGIRLRFKPLISALDDYNVANLVSEPLVVFLVATTGQGDPPDNMKQFWRFIWRKNLPLGCLATLKFAIIGFGDSSYQKFNFVAKKLRKRLLLLGGTEVIPPGFADDQHDLGSEAVAGPWIRDLWGKTHQLFPLPDGLAALPDDELLPPTFSTIAIEESVLSTSNTGTINTGNPDGTKVASEQEPFQSVLMENKRVTAQDHWQDVRLLTFDITDSNIRYSPGDVCYVQPKNFPDTVTEFIEMLQLKPETKVKFQSSDQSEVPLRLRGLCTVKYLVESYLDINSVPRRYFWELMAQFTDNDLERSKLKEFCSPEGQEDLYSYCNRPKRTVLEVMKDFPGASANIPFDYLFDLIPALRPRAFSIASSQTVHPDRLQLLVAVVKYKTNLASVRRGVCSNYLASLKPSSEHQIQVPIWVQKGTIRFPTSPTVSVIMIGPGTGCAPFRAYIQQRASESITAEKSVLFFGCRNRSKDFYFEDEWDQLQSSGSLQLFVAFSRDQDNKIYVQDIMEQQSTLLWDLIEKHEGCILVAGNSKNMPDSVRKELQRIVMAGSGRTEEEAEKYLQKMDSQQRYQLETWS